MEFSVKPSCSLSLLKENIGRPWMELILVWQLRMECPRRYSPSCFSVGMWNNCKTVHEMLIFHFKLCTRMSWDSFEGLNIKGRVAKALMQFREAQQGLRVTRSSSCVRPCFYSLGFKFRKAFKVIWAPYICKYIAKCWLCKEQLLSEWLVGRIWMSDSYREKHVKPWHVPDDWSCCF